jgi:hypothetical protein
VLVGDRAELRLVQWLDTDGDGRFDTFARETVHPDTLISVRGKPLMIVNDNGTELASHAALRRHQDTDVEWHYIVPGNINQSRIPFWKA